MSESVVYECQKCGGTMTEADLEDRGGHVKCIHCSYKVLKKVRTQFVKRVKAI
jgi:DNA-directed RNA polymerase subunit RPC12/RpoP